jgi:hypothetical protein
MTSDKVKSAIISYLGGNLSIPVVDAESMNEIELPCVAVKISEVSRFSLALSAVESITLQIVYREHEGDTSRSSIETQSDAISALLVDPETLKHALNTVIANGAHIDMIHFSGGSPAWDEATLECSWDGDCYAQRV